MSEKYNIPTAKQLLQTDLPQREWLLYPFIQQKSACMLYAKRGIGKTYLGLSIVLAVSAGVDFINFSVPNPRNVLYIDGEMAAQDLKTRITKLANGLNIRSDKTANLKILSSDLQNEPLPNLATKEGKEDLEKLITDIDLVILDNLSSLYNFGKENESESWRPMQDMIIRLKQLGKSILIVDHAGKNGDNRGTSRKQDIMDSIISLSNPDGYRQADGAFFTISYKKSRGVYGDELNDITVQLIEPNSEELIWVIQEPINKNKKRLEEQELFLKLHSEGKSIREIAKETGTSKTKVGDIIKMAARLSDN